ncbi:MAG: hypothetical protein HC878_00050 [Leptolyngbyaceae cyanobacterium SL_5_14]|nr:hypothetical protein [Leptolyngbyaceae cyanobacterium SL_5_14]
MTNPQKASDGSNAKTIEESINETIVNNRVQTLASLPSYEDAITNILGSQSRAKAIYGLNATKTGIEKGLVHVFAINNLRNPVNNRDVAELLSVLLPRVQAGTKLLISPMDLLFAQGSLIAKLNPGVDPEQAMDLLWEAFKEYFNNIEPGGSILVNKIQHFLMLTNALNYVDDFRVNATVNKIPMANAYTLAQAYSLEISLVSSTNQVYEGTRGELEPINYDPET